MRLGGWHSAHPAAPEALPGWLLESSLLSRHPRQDAQPGSGFETCSFARLSLSNRGKLSDFRTKRPRPGSPARRALQGPLGPRASQVAPW